MFQYPVRFRSRNGCISHRTLLVLLLPFLVIYLASAENFLKGQNATLTCKVDLTEIRSSTAPPPTYIWSKLSNDGERIAVASYVSWISKVREDGPLSGRAEFKPPVLYIHGLKITDSGTYHCQVVEVTGSSDTSSVKLEVNAVPTVSVDVSSSPVVDGASGKYVAAICRASAGKPPATIEWMYAPDGKIQESKNSLETLEDGSFGVKSILFLKPGLIGRPHNSTDPVTVKDWRKNFTCVVYHDYFENKQQAITAPINLLYPPDVTISVESNKLTCDALGNPLPSIIWKRPDGTTEVGSASIFVDQSTPSASSGRYVCLARSSIGPDAVAAIDVQKSRNLPTLFTNTLRYNASLPLKAKNYDIECIANLENMGNSELEAVFFVWTKDGKIIEEKLSRYTIQQSTIAISRERVQVKSVLRILQVQRKHDEGLFKCRLSFPTVGTGYVRALERAINVKVDYPPDKVVSSIYPGTTVIEHTAVRLSCHALSSPPSSYLWYFNGKAISSLSELVLHNISRTDAGTYKCVASNYVPGSASREVRLVVTYPPGRVVIYKVKSELFCTTEGGSVPAPLYTWLLPNGTLTDGNKSVLEIPSFDVSSSMSYTCLVGNGLKQTSNDTFHLPVPAKAGIGSLTIGEFVVTVVVSFLLLVIIICVAIWVVKRYKWGRKSVDTATKNDTKTSTLLEYTDHPYRGSLTSMSVPHNVFDDTRLTDGVGCGGGKPFSSEGMRSANYDTSAPLPNGETTVMSPKVDGKLSPVNYATLTLKTNLKSANEGEKAPSRYKSVEVLDGSGVEILENLSMMSAKDKESTLPRTIENSPLRMTTFSQLPSTFGDRPLALNNYNTARNSAREKVKDAGLTRALSENFRPVLFDDTTNLTKFCNSEVNTDVKNNETSTDSVKPPPYSSSGDRTRVISPHPTVSTPIPHGSTHFMKKGDDGIGYSSDSSGSITSNREPSIEYAHVSSASNIGGITNHAYPGFRLDSVSRDAYHFQPDMEFRSSPVPSRCQSVNQYSLECASPMAEIPSRNYLYHPYTDCRLGIPLHGPKSSSHNTPTTIGSPYDSGSDSKSSNATTVTSNGRRMQSLTLV